MKRKFILIDTKTFDHAYYEDSKRIVVAEMSQVMWPEQLKEFYERPFDFIKKLKEAQ